MPQHQFIKNPWQRRREIGVIDRGQSVITDGYKLPAKYIIHTVGTAWQGGSSGEEDVIRKCYRSVFRIAADHGIESLAIPLLASGSYGFPKGIALRIALSEIEAFMSDHDLELFLVVFDEKSFSLSAELYGDIDAFINDSYVEEKKLEEYHTTFGPRDERSIMAAGSFAGATKIPDFLKADQANRQMREDSDEGVDVCRDICLPRTFSGVDRSLEDVVKNLDKTFMELVFSFADAKGLNDVEVQKRANLSRKAFSKLKCGTTKNPSKATALALAIALEFLKCRLTSDQ